VPDAAPETEGTGRTARRVHSVAHDDLERLVYIHLDVEAGGPDCGLTQISAVCDDPSAAGLDVEELPSFDEYVRPPTGVRWCPKAKEITGLHAGHASIRTAKPIEEVWPRFVAWVEEKLQNGAKRGVIVAWGGKSCDVEWIFKLTEISHVGRLHKPRWAPYFWDPVHTLKNYKKCTLHDRANYGYGLGTVWCRVTANDTLPNAHNSLVDARAQYTVVQHGNVMTFADSPNGIVLMEDVYKAKRVRNEKRDAETSRPIPPGWQESDETVRVPPSKDYTGALGGPQHGPCGSDARDTRTLRELFFLFFPLVEFFQRVAHETNRYGNQQWVKVQKYAPAGATKMRTRLVAASVTDRSQKPVSLGRRAY
jgi:hypothetical protein